MSATLPEIVREFVAARGGGEGYFPTGLEGVHVLSSLHRVEANHRLYRPSLCIVIQGGKQILFGDRTLDYGEMQALIINMELPACGRIIRASPTEPFVGVTIDFDVAAMREVLAQIDAPPSPNHAGPSLFVADVDAPLADCVIRLMRLAGTPRAVPVLLGAVMREIYYWLLTGPHGSAVRRLALPDSHMDRISRAISLLRQRFAEPLRTEQLAEAARMSPSSFHQHFKALTAMTPLQFQKQLRLLEARRLMVADAAGVTEAAYQVGYESASQFSREYARAFGAAPKRDAMTLRGEPA